MTSAQVARCLLHDVRGDWRLDRRIVPKPQLGTNVGSIPGQESAETSTGQRGEPTLLRCDKRMYVTVRQHAWRRRRSSTRTEHTSEADLDRSSRAASTFLTSSSPSWQGANGRAHMSYVKAFDEVETGIKEECSLP